VNPAAGDEDNVSVAEVARRLNMAVATIARWARDGRIPSTRTVDGMIQFRPADVATVSITAPH
jgi:excisionase family DNA binding protein